MIGDKSLAMVIEKQRNCESLGVGLAKGLHAFYPFQTIHVLGQPPSKKEIASEHRPMMELSLPILLASWMEKT